MKHGNVIALGKHRLLCGDAFNVEHVNALLQGEKPGMLYCDPPYGMGLNTDNRHRSRFAPGESMSSTTKQGRVVQLAQPAVRGDDTEFNPSRLILQFSQCQEQFWWGADYYRAHLPSGGSWVVWDKRVHEHLDTKWGACFELCWSRAKHKRDIARVLWEGVLGMNGIDRGRRYHPTQKPIRLAEWFISRYSKEGDIICDLFGGSGSTLLACERLNRRALIAEISPDYCDVIQQRYEHLAQQPRLLDAI